MASLSKSKNGRYWRIVFFNSRKVPKQKEILRPTKDYDPDEGLTRLQAERLKKDLEHDYKNGWNPWEDEAAKSLQPNLTLTLAMEKALASFKGIEASTLNNRREVLNTFLEEFGRKLIIDRLSSKVINTWVNEPSKFSYRQKRKDVLGLMFKFLHSEYGYEIPTLTVEATRSEKNEYYNKDFKTFLLEEQLHYALNHIDKLRDNSRTRHDRELLKQYYLLSFYTGRRRADLLAIKGDWISFTQPLIHLFDDEYSTKAKRFEYISLSEKSWTILKSIHRPGYLFEGFSPSFVTKEFKKLMRATMPEEIAEKVSLHKLRDSSIMHMLYREDLDVKDVMARVGHAGFASLQKYIHQHGSQIIKVKLEQWERHLSDIENEGK